jgi:hypothetical protein
MSDALGLDHPLTRASAALGTIVRQLLIVGAMLAGSIAASIEHAVWARSLAVASAIVLVGFAAAALSRGQARRDRALDLIVEGRERVPVAIVQRQRRRLSRQKTQRTLGRALDSMIEDALYRPRPLPLSSRPLLHRPLVARLEHELRAVAKMLRSGAGSVRGVAFCERLVTTGTSSLYGEDPLSLRGELRRAQALLELS